MGTREGPFADFVAYELQELAIGNVVVTSSILEQPKNTLCGMVGEDAGVENECSTSVEELAAFHVVVHDAIVAMKTEE